MPGATDSASHIHKSNHLSSLPTTTPRHLALLPGSFVLFFCVSSVFSPSHLFFSPIFVFLSVLAVCCVTHTRHRSLVVSSVPACGGTLPPRSATPPSSSSSRSAPVPSEQGNTAPSTGQRSRCVCDAPAATGPVPPLSVSPLPRFPACCTPSLSPPSPHALLPFSLPPPHTPHHRRFSSRLLQA